MGDRDVKPNYQLFTFYKTNHILIA